MATDGAGGRVDSGAAAAEPRGRFATWVPATHGDSQRAMRVALMRAATAVAVIAGAGGSGCGQTVLTGRAPVVLVMDRLEGASGAEPAELSNVLHSDVETLVGRSVAAGETSAPTVFSRFRQGGASRRLEGYRAARKPCNTDGEQRSHGQPITSPIAAPMAAASRAWTCPTASTPP